MKKNYYHILGLSNRATLVEIKSAFRKLAVLYHPDKNQGDPDTAEKFQEIKEAYDILINPELKKRFDSGYHYNMKYSKKESETSQSKKTRGKRYSFTEQEFKNRQAFAKNYKSTHQKKAKESHETIVPYNDFKYIMISIPLSIAILFLVINLLSKDPSHLYKGELAVKKNIKESVGNPEKNSNDLSSALMGVSLPWDSIFGQQEYDSSSNRTLYIENLSGLDVVICIRNVKSKRVIRNNYIFNKNFYFIQNIPAGEYLLYAFYGKDWDKNKITTKNKKFGSFSEPKAYVLLEQGKSVKYTAGSDTFRLVLPKIETIAPAYLKSNKEFFLN